MASLSFTLNHLHTTFNYYKTNSFPVLTHTTKLQFPNSTFTITLPIHYPSIRYSNSAKLVRGNSSISEPLNETPHLFCHKSSEETFRIFKRWIKFVRAVLPGGSWWNLPNFNLEIGAKPMNVFEALTRMWALVAEEKWILYIAFGALTVAALTEISMPAIITTCIFSAQNGATLVFYRNSKLLLLLFIISGICSGLRSGCFAVANMILVKRLRKTVFSSLLLQDMSFFERETVGDLTSRIGTDCQRLSHTMGNDIHLILRNILQGTGAFINLMSLSWPLALSSLVICLILSVIFLFYGLYQKKAAMLAQDFVASSNEAAQETLSLIRIVRAYGTEKEEFKRFAQWLDRLAFVGLRESVAYGLWNLSFMALYRMTQVLAVFLGGTSVVTGCVSAEQLTKYILYCEWLIYAAWRVQDNMSSLLQSVGACEKVFQLMHLNPSCEFLSKGVKMQRLTGRIEFVNVSFHYPSRNMDKFQNIVIFVVFNIHVVPILENVNFSITANEVVAIVGVSGSGKSTLINLLLRLYEPISGEILINGTPLREMDIRWLREKIGVVGQEPHIFHMDVKSNISYGCFKSITHEEIKSAAMIANAHEFISSLPSGYDTIIDNNLLSGGQKQRIAIARAVIRDPAILVLDEATSALDAESEGYITEILHSMRKDLKTQRTIIIIAHRLSTLKSADRVLVMDNGQIIEIGNHIDLLQKNGLYARLVKMQTDSSLVIRLQKEGLLE